MIVLVVNCGSSSLKYQLVNMDNEEVMAKGVVEKIGLSDSLLTHKWNGQKKKSSSLFRITKLLLSSYWIF